MCVCVCFRLGPLTDKSLVWGGGTCVCGFQGATGSPPPLLRGPSGWHCPGVGGLWAPVITPSPSPPCTPVSRIPHQPKACPSALWESGAAQQASQRSLTKEGERERKRARERERGRDGRRECNYTGHKGVHIHIYSSLKYHGTQ